MIGVCRMLQYAAAPGLVRCQSICGRQQVITPVYEGHPGPATGGSLFGDAPRRLRPVHEQAGLRAATALPAASFWSKVPRRESRPSSMQTRQLRLTCATWPWKAGDYYPTIKQMLTKDL